MSTIHLDTLASCSCSSQSSKLARPFTVSAVRPRARTVCRAQQSQTISRRQLGTQSILTGRRAQSGRVNLQRCSAVDGKLISSTEVPAFIPRDDMIDQLYRWALSTAGESGLQNFGMPMKIEPNYNNDVLWGFTVTILKEGVKQTDLGIGFDGLAVARSEWIGRGEDGFPFKEGKQTDVQGKMFEIWKLDTTPVSEDLRSTIRSFCTGLAAALSKYYAFGSVFAEEI